MSSDKAGGYGVAVGLGLGILGLLGGPIGVIAGIGAFAGGWTIGKALKNRNRDEIEDDNNDVLYPLPDLTERHYNTSSHNSRTLPDIDVSQFITPERTHASNNRPFNYLNGDEYHIPIQTPRPTATPRPNNVLHNQPAGTYSRENRQASGQSQRRLRVNKYGEIFEE